MTAITEITRNGSRSARGLVSIQSRLNQVVDESSSTGKQLIELYKEQNIALFDQNGQLRDSYDILKDLAAVWPNLTRNQQAEFALAQAGANQTQNFTALMNNFKVAIDATATAMDSAGSAMKENTSYMESLEAQTTQLKATFQDFANNVIDKELISSILTLANDVLGALNTETGKTITQWGLLTGVLTGGIVIYGQIAGKLLSAGSAVISLTKALSAGEATATMFTSAALPIAAAIGAIAVAGWKVYEWYKDTHQPLSEYTSQIESNNEQLEKNQERLKEINEMSWVDRTPDILAEKEALEKENAELRENIALNEKRSLDQAKRLANQEVTVTTGSRYKSSLLGMDWASEEEAIKDINDIYGEGTWVAGVYIKTLKEVNTTITAQGDALNNYLINELEKYDDILRSNNSLTEEEQIARNNIIQAAKSQVETYQFLDEKVGGLTESQKNLISAYNESVQVEAEAKDWTEKYGDALIITDEQAQQLIKTFPILKDHLKQTNEGWVVLETTVGETASALISADGRIKKSSKDRVASTLADIKAEVEAYKELYTITLYQPYSNTDPDYEEKKRKIGEAKKGYEASAAALVRLQQAVARTKTEGYYDDTPKSLTSPASTTKNKNTTTKKATDLALEEFKNLQKDLEHQKELGLIKEKEYYDKLEQLVKDYKVKATAHMKEYGTEVDTINRNMYQYEEEIYKGRAKLADDLAEQQKKAAEEAAQAQKEAAEKAAQAQKEALEKQKEDFETAVNYVIKQIDEEINKLQNLRDQTEQYYDDKIDAVNEANDALEDQIHYEELLNNLAKAKDKKLYVFQNGQFQYVQDVEAIASAQAELDTYERDKALQEEVKNLETLKEQALASIDEQIEGWEKYKEQWESVTTQYQEQQEKLLAEQVLGIDAEQENWNTRLANVQSFVDQYNSILSQLNSGASGTSSGSTGGSSSAGDGYYFDYSKGNGGWTEQELLESNPEYFQNGGTGTSKSSSNNNSSNNPWQSAYDSYVAKGDYESANQVIEEAESRGQTVSKHAIGTLSAPGGLSLVGEYGPELRVLNSGDGIIPADATRNLWDWGAYNPKDFMGRMGSDNIFHIGNIALPNVTDAKSFVNGLKQLAYQRAYKRA